MALKIRLQRGGKTHAPHFRMVVAESTTRRDGRFVEVLGTYNPRAKLEKDTFRLKLDRIDYWLSVGATPTDTARSLVNKARRREAELAPPVAPTPAPPVETAETPEPVEIPAGEESSVKPEA